MNLTHFLGLTFKHGSHGMEDDAEGTSTFLIYLPAVYASTEELIELNCNPFPPSLKPEVSLTIRRKENLKKKTEDQIMEMQ